MRSPDLASYDFSLWGFLKSCVYVNHPRVLLDLKANIRAEIANIPTDMLWLGEIQGIGLLSVLTMGGITYQILFLRLTRKKTLGMYLHCKKKKINNF